MTVNGKTEYWGNSYGYDAWGNLITKTPTKCSAENLSVSALNNNQLSGYGYDAAGNMTHDATTNVNYSYDAENRITGGGSYTYIYDADGNRVEKSNGSTGTIYWYMTPGIVAESDLKGNPKSEYVFFAGERIARKDFPGNAVSYYFSDQLKTASVITNSTGAITEDEDYYPWGGELQFVNNDSNHYKFTSKERDSETGLDYFGARYYGNALGRFATPDDPFADQDQADPQSWNMYSYVRNNPTDYSDPDGHDCVVQTRTDSNRETVNLSSGNCDNVKVGDGQTKTYVPGTVDVNSLRNDGKGGITFSFKPYDGSATGVGYAKWAPAPDHPGIAYYWRDNAQAYRTLDQATTTVKLIGAATLAVSGANLIMMGAGPLGEFLREQAFLRAQAAWKSFPAEQFKLINQFFKTGVVPPALTPQAMAAYIALAKAYLAAGKGGVVGMAVQFQRLEQLIKALEKMRR
jgi:RHS repeat-associated protein